MKIRTVAIICAFTIVGSAGCIKTASAQTPPAPTLGGSSFEQRLAQRQAERRIALEQKDRARIGSVCVQLQSKIRALQPKTTSMLDNRFKVYQRIDAKLWIAVGQLRLAEKDTFNFEKSRANYAEGISKFQTSSANYKQVLDDSTVINCQADPSGFKALVETARIYHQDLRTQSAALRSQIVGEIKTILANHAAELEPKPSSEGEKR